MSSGNKCAVVFLDQFLNYATGCVHLYSEIWIACSVSDSRAISRMDPYDHESRSRFLEIFFSKRSKAGCTIALWCSLFRNVFSWLKSAADACCDCICTCMLIDAMHDIINYVLCTAAWIRPNQGHCGILDWGNFLLGGCGEGHTWDIICIKLCWRYVLYSIPWRWLPWRTETTSIEASSKRNHIRCPVGGLEREVWEWRGNQGTVYQREWGVRTLGARESC